MPQHSNHRSPRRGRQTNKQTKKHEKILEEIIVEKCPKMGNEIITQVQETQRVPNRINPRQNTPRHILVKLTKIKSKEQIKSRKGKTINNTKGDSHQDNS